MSDPKPSSHAHHHRKSAVNRGAHGGDHRERHPHASRPTAAETAWPSCSARRGHPVVSREIVPDEAAKIAESRCRASLARDDVRAVILTGGTGVAPRDVTPEAVEPLLERVVPGFGELFRALSYEDIGSAALLSRALAGWRGARGVRDPGLPRRRDAGDGEARPARARTPGGRGRQDPLSGSPKTDAHVSTGPRSSDPPWSTEKTLDVCAGADCCCWLGGPAAAGIPPPRRPTSGSTRTASPTSPTIRGEGFPGRSGRVVAGAPRSVGRRHRAGRVSRKRARGRCRPAAEVGAPSSDPARRGRRPRARRDGPRRGRARRACCASEPGQSRGALVPGAARPPARPHYAALEVHLEAFLAAAGDDLEPWRASARRRLLELADERRLADEPRGDEGRPWLGLSRPRTLSRPLRPRPGRGVAGLRGDGAALPGRGPRVVGERLGAVPRRADGRRLLRQGRLPARPTATASRSRPWASSTGASTSSRPAHPAGELRACCFTSTPTPSFASRRVAIGPTG